MSQVMRRYPVPIQEGRYSYYSSGEVHIELPIGSNVLSFAAIDSELYVWAQIESEETRMEKHRLFLIGDNLPIPLEASRFLGTVVRHEELFDWHLFYLPGVIPVF